MKKSDRIGLSLLLSYLAAIRPRMKGRAEQIRGQYYAHRGLHNKKAGVPENTMTAFCRAVEAGYGIELDVQLTKDQEVVVFHDFDLKRICHVKGDVSDYTYEELQQFPICGTKERIPRFEDVLKMVDGRVPLLVEIKYKEFGSRICPKADRYLQDYKGPYVMESFHPLALLWYRLHRPEIARGQLSMNFQRRETNYLPPHLLVRHLLLNFVGRPDFIAYDIRDRGTVSRNICRSFFGCPCAAWTVKSRTQLKEAKKGFDAFIFEGFMPKTY